MNEPTTPAGEAKPGAKGFLVRIVNGWQWLVATFFALLTLMLVLSQPKLRAPGAPMLLFWIAVAVGVIVALAHAPPVIRRLPGHWTAGPYIVGFGFFVLMGVTMSQMDAAWEKTPQGAAEAKRYEAERDAEIAEGVRQRAQETELQQAREAEDQIADAADKLEGCFTTFGHRLPALEKSIKASLHNPSAFEHVETLAIVPDADRNNVAVKFRAENGFGAIRLGLVKAAVDPNTCEVVSQGNLEPL